MSYKENAFPIGMGKVNLTSGIRTDTLVYWCVADGTLQVTWSDATTDDIALIAGDAVNIENSSTVTSVEITAGTFHVA